MKTTIFLFIIFLFSFKGNAQDTFSIVALDSTSREVGSAGASCLDLFTAGYSNPAFLADILPDTGVVNTQSYFMQANQDNARAQMRAGSTPAQIITWLVANDAINNPEFKQYGIVGFNGNTPSAVSHTGSSCINYKNHVVGNINGFYYAIQGNILKGQEILDSMEARFRNTSGTLACRIMAAMQGANVIGADTRCTSENTSSLFAFLQVAKPTDTYGSPSLNLTLRTKSGEGIEPIDSLQVLFDIANGCNPLTVKEYAKVREWDVYPNPARTTLFIRNLSASFENEVVDSFPKLYNAIGQLIRSTIISDGDTLQLDIADLSKGVYFVQWKSQIRKVIIE